MFAKFINTEFEKISEIKTGADLNRIFFRLVQVISITGLIYFLLFTMPVLIQLGRVTGVEELGFSYISFTAPLLLILAQIGVAELGLRMVTAGKFTGIAIGLALSLWLIFSWLFLVGAFGLYCFLNSSFQEKHASVFPDSFVNLLTAMSLNRIQPKI